MTTPTITLGIHDGHTATAALMRDGVILACVSEERLNGQKEWAGFPTLAVQECLELSDIKPEQVTRVGICSTMPQIGDAGYQNPSFPKRVFGLATQLLPAKLLQSELMVRIVQSLGNLLYGSRREATRQSLKELGITAPAQFYDHHLCHAATSYFLSWNREAEETLVCTLDGSGDGVCGSVRIGSGETLQTLSEIFNYNSICDFYTRVTQYLGMKPMAHEFKVMGMAPYADKKRSQPALELFRSWFRVSPHNPLQIINTSGTWKWRFLAKLRRELKLTRFDLISGALQEMYEEVVLEWIRNALQVTGKKHLALSGGGFMNVKLNYLISELPEVESLFIFPGCGDDSNPVGACALAAVDAGLKREDIAPVGMPYWGRSYSDQDIKEAIEATLDPDSFNIRHCADPNQVLAELLAEGKVAGRFTGRMEWGARALGNRSIVADARNAQIIHKINKAIKVRDFWMPFAPAILESYRDDYVDLREDYRCCHMTIAPPSKPAAHSAITAGLHPFDRTARCQIVDPVNHPGFHDLISKYQRLTSVGGILNTSFNLHGEPIVMSPNDAIRTFLQSELEVLQLDDWIITK